MNENSTIRNLSSLTNDQIIYLTKGKNKYKVLSLYNINSNKTVIIDIPSKTFINNTSEKLSFSEIIWGDVWIRRKDNCELLI